jgi:hypothetical protein
MLAMNRMVWIAFLWLLGTVFAGAADAEYFADRIAPLIQQSKLKTLGERGANPRVLKYTYWLSVARTHGVSAEAVVEKAMSSALIRKMEKRELTRAAMLRNLLIAERLGCLDAAGLEQLRRGNAPTVKVGPYRGDELSVDHIIPRSVVPELDNVIANLELMPARMNSAKSSSIGERQKALTQQLAKAGWLSKSGLRKVLSASK